MFVCVAVVCSLMSSSAAAVDDVPHTYRSNVQVVAPLNDRMAFTALASYSDTASTSSSVGRSTIIAIPGGLDYRIDGRWSLQTYLQFNRDSLRSGADRLEIRPVGGVTYRTRLTDVVDAGAWLRYEARFLDVTGNDSFQNRLRLRPYVDYKFGHDPGAAGSWHLRGEYEPRYVFGSGPSYVNGQQLRLTLGYKASAALMADLRFARDFTRTSPSDGFAATNNSVTLQFIYTLGKSSARGVDSPQ